MYSYSYLLPVMCAWHFRYSHSHSNCSLYFCCCFVFPYYSMKLDPFFSNCIYWIRHSVCVYSIDFMLANGVAYKCDFFTIHPGWSLCLCAICVMCSVHFVVFVFVLLFHSLESHTLIHFVIWMKTMYTHTSCSSAFSILFFPSSSDTAQ